MRLKARKVYPVWPEGKQKVFTMSYDDGNDSDIPLVELMRRYHVKGTFNLNSGLWPEEIRPYEGKKQWRRLTMQECLELYGDDMEIALHGRVHPSWDRLPSVGMMQDILDDRRELERATGRIIRGAAYPNGHFNQTAKDVLRLAGVEYCRAVKVNANFEALPVDFMELQGTVRNVDPKVIDVAKAFAAPKTPYRKPWMMYLWGHSYEFVRDGSWDVIEEVLSIVGDREDIWYATNVEMVDYMKAVRRLQYNVDMTMVHNPSGQSVWVQITRGRPVETVVEIPAGKTVMLPEE